MSKVDTDQGLGPPSSESRVKSADAAEGQASPQASRKADTLDELLDDFGPQRPDQPRIRPNAKAETTPPPSPVKKELTPTEPGMRQKRNRVLVATTLAIVVTLVLGLGVLKLVRSSPETPRAPSATETQTARQPPPETLTATVATAAETVLAPAASVTATTAAPPAHTAQPHHTSEAPRASATAHPTTTAASTATAHATAHPAGSAPPGMNLLPDDPHR